MSIMYKESNNTEDVIIRCEIVRCVWFTIVNLLLRPGLFGCCLNGFTGQQTLVRLKLKG